MRHQRLQNVKNTFWQVAAIVIIAALPALAVNALRPDGIALVSDWSPAARLEAATDGSNMMIPMEQAVSFHESREAVFIDTRSPEAFSEGRITGAINIPENDIFDRLAGLMDAVPDKNRILVVYCKKAPCPLSQELVRLLKDMGYENARFLENGWAGWQDRGYPAAEGEKGLNFYF
ncbi:MAG: rhodanese-like domain-containing protein [Desulfobacterales bacterium]|nr:rhodanese-like domain-containing protein [Desulfobacterales bacterium]MBS3754080.1 rhodanese-like domain-containing protein [Desulfobacterales bacterium]